MADQPEIDPRYDPAFQRGYGGATPRPDAARRPAPHVTSALQRSTPSSHVGARDRHVAPAPASSAPDAVPGGAANAAAAIDAPPASAPVPSVVHVAAPTMRPPWANPFAIVVAIVGIGALGAGVWLLQETFRLTQEENGFQTQADYWFMQWGMIGGPIFTGLGVAILVAVLMLCAVYWGRRPEQGSPPVE